MSDIAVITADAYLDGGTARTAGEAWTCNGGRLTVRTDSRWHANAPASMTGSLGAVAISSTLGGGYTIDGTAVRWMPYDSGTGNVPAIGTTVSQGGASGYLLGVWADYTSAPTAVGAAMPSSGYLKFREVTGGPFATGALSGIGASATGPDVVGWIEVVHDQAITITVPRLGDFTVRGDWFDLGTTSGSANQVVQVPTNGSTTTYVPGVWIATTATPTTDEDWEFYPSIYAAGMSTTNLGTDERSKFVLMGTDGTITIGHNGTTDVGYVPPAGRGIRVPNVFGRQCATASRATNAIPHATAGTRPDFTTTSAGAIDIENFAVDWYLAFAQPYSVKLHHVATFDYINTSECATALDIYDGGNGISQSLDVNTILLTSNFAGGTIDKWTAHRYATGANDHAISVNYCIGQTFSRVLSGIVTYARTTSGVACYINQSTNITQDNCTQFNGQTTLTTSFDCTVSDLDHCDRYVGTTNATSGIYAVGIANSCVNILVDGITFGLGGAISNCHPYLGVVTSAASSVIKIRNLGSRSAFLDGGSANNPGYIFVSGGNNVDVRVQRCYMTPTRSGAINTVNSDTVMLYEHVYGDYGDIMTIASLNSVARGCGGTNTTTGQASVYGTHFWDAFISDTAGRVVLSLNEPTEVTDPYVTVVSGTPRFTSAGNLSMPTVGDEIIIEQDYRVLGCTALTNTAPVVTGTNVTYSSGARWGNHDIYYQIDTGSGWNGTWNDLTAANLSGETISPSVGFKLKYRMVCATANTGNLLTYIRIATTSTAQDQTDNLYPLATNGLTLTGLKNPTEIRVFDAGTTTEIAGQESVTSGTFTTEIDAGTYPAVDISIISLGYQNTRLLNVDISAGDVSIPVQQVIDRQYLNP